MYLDWTYKPRRRRGKGCFVWVGLVLFLALYLYQQRPDWLVRQSPQPTAPPTRSAIFWQAEAEAHIAAGDFSSAIAALQRMAELEPDNAEPLVALADLYMMARQIDQVFALSQQALRIDAENVAALAMHARALDWLGQYEAASDFAFDALDLEPDNPDVLAVLGEIYSDVGNWPRAQAYLDEALSIDPDNILARRNLAVLYELQKDYERAIVELDRAIELAPNRPDLYIEKGRQYHYLDEWGAAIESYEQAVAVAETSFSLDALGWGLYNSGDSLQALRVLRRAVELDPQNGAALAHLGLTYYARRNYEAAAPLLEQAVAILGDEESRIDYYYTLGLAYIYKKPKECHLAVPWLRKALDIDPNASSALEGMRLCS